MNQYHKSIFNFILIIIFISFNLIAWGHGQDYLWPMKAEKELTAVFGEERPGRYHTGIDIRTFGEIGYPLQAIESGYISRIQTSSKKYGKTIYLTLDDGNTVVYAHLDHFMPELDNLVNALHQYYQKYTIDHYFDNNEHIIKKGEIIGYSGDTGGVSGPHLHFEIRDQNQQPINPFLHGLSILDDIPPIINSLAIIPLNKNSYINGISEEQVFNVRQLNKNEYILLDTISTQGSIGLAINTFDRITNQEFNFGIYNVELFQNDKFIYSMQYDNINWKDSNKLYTEKNYSLARKGLGKFYHLFSSHGNQSLTFINNNSLPNLIIKNNEFHNITIKVGDYATNQSLLRLVLSSELNPKFDYSVQFSNDTCFIQFKTKEKIIPFFHKNSRYDKTNRTKIKHEELENNLFILTNVNAPLDVVEVAAKNKRGLMSKSTFHIPQNNQNIDFTGNLTINHYEHGIIINFEESEFSGIKPFYSLEKKGAILRQDFHSISPFLYTSKIYSPLEFDNITTIRVYYENLNHTEIFKMNLSGTMILPESKFEFSLLNEEIKISGHEHTFYDTTFMWAQYVEVELPIHGKMVSKAYEIQPNLIPYNKEIQLEIALTKNDFPEHVSIYYYNKKNNSWHYMPSTFTSDSTFMKTSILSGEIFAIIKETTLPIFSSFIPEINGTYYSMDLNHVSFYIEDEFAGIDAEEDIVLELDGKRVIFEYNSYQKKIRYPLKDHLKEGKHTLYVKAMDRVGNIAVKKGFFHVK